ncbi:MAG: deoxyribose-phosphate aldolase [Bacteroidales bacterium]
MENINNILDEAAGRERANMAPEVYAKCLSCIDLTSLNSTDTIAKITSMTNKVNSFKTTFPAYPQVAAICVYPNFASTVRENLKDKDVQIAVVGGVFPSSQSFLEVKVAECKMAVEQGANEVDVVLALNHFLAGQNELAAREISEIKKAIGAAHLKVILESGSINEPGQIYKASMLAMEAGAHFIKTSTGKTEPAATPEAAVVMCIAILDYFNKTGRKVGFKPAGGISTPEDVVKYFSIVQTILGDQWLHKKLFRIGASRLANSLLSLLENRDVSYF